MTVAQFSERLNASSAPMHLIAAILERPVSNEYGGADPRMIFLGAPALRAYACAGAYAGPRNAPGA